MSIRKVTLEEVEANKSIGWYANPGGGVYQVITVSPPKVKWIGHVVKPQPDDAQDLASEQKSVPKASSGEPI